MKDYQARKVEDGLVIYCVHEDGTEEALIHIFDKHEIDLTGYNLADLILDYYLEDAFQRKMHETAAKMKPFTESELTRMRLGLYNERLGRLKTFITTTPNAKAIIASCMFLLLESIYGSSEAAIQQWILNRTQRRETEATTKQ